MLQFEDSDDSVAKFLLPMDVFSVTTAACSFPFFSFWNITQFTVQLQVWEQCLLFDFWVI